jgi:hypothetical protein
MAGQKIQTVSYFNYRKYTNAGCSQPFSTNTPFFFFAIIENACEWSGVLCDPSTEQIVAIELQDAGLIGTIPSKLGLLSSLKVLMLSQNSLKGTVPQHILDLPFLEVLNVSHNQLTGELPWPLSAQLKDLILSNNKFSGSIPSENFEERYEDGLLVLDLSMNYLHGTIPSRFGSLVTLKILALSGNKLYGEFLLGARNKSGALFEICHSLISILFMPRYILHLL